MNEAGAESGIQQEERKFESPAIVDDAYRMKVAALRDGVRQILGEHEIPLGPEVSNSALLAILSQAMSNRDATVTYIENLSSNWRDEYRRIVEQIAVMMSHPGFGVKTESQDIVESIKERLAV